MKKIILMAAVAGMVFASCTNDNEDYDIKVQKKQQISFAKPVFYGMTRAYEASYGDINPYDGQTGGYPTTESFTVFGVSYVQGNSDLKWHEATPVIGSASQGETTTYKDATAVQSWFTKKAHYFDEGLEYSFAAFSPSNIVTNDGDNISAAPGASLATTATYNNDNKNLGLSIMGYTPGNMGSQVDLMYAPRIVKQKASNLATNVTDGTSQTGSATTYDGLNLIFKHALSSVHIKVGFKKSFEDWMQNSAVPNYTNELKKFRVKTITIKNVATKGDFLENTNDGLAASSSTSDSNPTWTLKETGNYEFVNTAASNFFVPENTNDKGKDLTEETFVHFIDASSNTANILGGYQGLFIPQTLGAVGATPGNPILNDVANKKKAELVIVWTRPKNDSWDTASDNVEEVTTTIDLSAITPDWVIGKRYTYTILFSRDVIYFAPQITDWTETSANGSGLDNNTIVEIPVNKKD